MISIIITVLNGESTISNTLRSIKNQTFTDFELILVDGGSIDNTITIIDSFDIPTKRLFIVNGIGLYAGLNYGISKSTGQWLYFMGADDTLHQKDTLKQISSFIKNHVLPDTSVIVGNVNFVEQNIVFRPTLGKPVLLAHQVHHQGMLYRRQVFHNKKYNENMRIASDYMFNLELAIHGLKHQYADVLFCDYSGSGLSVKQHAQGYLEMQKIHKELFTGYTKHWVVFYFWLRRKIGKYLREANLSFIREYLRKRLG